MPDYTVTVTRSKIILEDYPVTAANEAAAEAVALEVAKTTALEREVGSFDWVSDGTAD